MFLKWTEKSGPAIDKGLADVVNEGLQSVGQSEELKKLREKFIRPSNVDDLQVPKVDQSHGVTSQTKENPQMQLCRKLCPNLCQI